MRTDEAALMNYEEILGPETLEDRGYNMRVDDIDYTKVWEPEMLRRVKDELLILISEENRPTVNEFLNSIRRSIENIRQERAVAPS